MQIFDEIDSTQIEARRQIDAKGIIINDAILAHNQVSGISTKKKYPWISQKGDLNVSIIKNIDEIKNSGEILLNHLPFCGSIATNDVLIEMCGGLSVFDTITNEINNLNLFFKWPNDLLLYNEKSEIKYKKICGVLCEIYKNHFIIGIGLNLVSFPETTEHFKATSIENETGIKLNNVEVAEKIIVNVDKNIQQVQKYGFSSIKNKWKEKAYMLGEVLTLNDNGKVIFEDITDDGYLLVREKDGKQRVIISSDEVIG